MLTSIYVTSREKLCLQFNVGEIKLFAKYKKVKVTVLLFGTVTAISRGDMLSL